MGGCCYTPTKRDFLWWYWLLLLSVVGIPMLLAALFVQYARARRQHSEETVGRGAALIFWLGSIAMLALSFCLVAECVRFAYPADAGEPYVLKSQHHEECYFDYVFYFASALIGANTINGGIRKKHWLGRLPLFVMYLGVFLLLMTVFGSYRAPAIYAMHFLACMAPAHCWGEFRAAPSTKWAWLTLLAFCIAAPLFCVFTYFAMDIVAFLRLYLWGLSTP
jgi:hypothetical protein